MQSWTDSQLQEIRRQVQLRRVRYLLEAIETGEAQAQANLSTTILKPTSERVTADVIEPPLGFGMHGDLDGDGITDSEQAGGPIAGLLNTTDEEEEEE